MKASLTASTARRSRTLSRVRHAPNQFDSVAYETVGAVCRADLRCRQDGRTYAYTQILMRPLLLFRFQLFAVRMTRTRTGRSQLTAHISPDAIIRRPPTSLSSICRRRTAFRRRRTTVDELLENLRLRPAANVTLHSSLGVRCAASMTMTGNGSGVGRGRDKNG